MKAKKNRKGNGKLRRVEKSLQDLTAAEAELRKHAAMWVAVIRARITALAEEVAQINQACREDTVLGRVIGIGQLSAVSCDLYNADCAASGLTITGVDLPIPDLLAMENYVTSKLFPRAAEGAKFMAAEESKS